MKKKTALFMGVLLIAALWTGCGRSNIPADPEAHTATPLPTETPVETPTPEPTPEPIVPEEVAPESDLPAGKMYSYLTGEVVDEAYGKQRPFAVMINNLSPAVPQSSLPYADLLYEAYVEGSITRLMAVYQDVSQIQKIGPIRSSRHYYLDFSDDNDAIYTHFGWSAVAEQRIHNEGRTTINGMDFDGSMGFFRTSDRYAPHNAYATGEGLRGLAQGFGLRMTYEEGYEPNLVFNKEDKEPEEGEGATVIQFPYPVNNPWFEYNAEDRQYYRFEYGSPHVDMETGEQLKFKNVVVQYVEQSSYNGDPILLELYLTGAGTGLYFTDGKMQRIYWEKNSLGVPTKYYDDKGAPLALNPGKTMFQIAPPEMAITWSGNVDTVDTEVEHLEVVGDPAFGEDTQEG